MKWVNFSLAFVSLSMVVVCLAGEMNGVAAFNASSVAINFYAAILS